MNPTGITEKILYQHPSGDMIVERLNYRTTHWDMYLKDVLGRYWQGEKLTALIRFAESNGIDVRSRSQVISGKIGSVNVLNRML